MSVDAFADELHFASQNYRQSRTRLPHGGPWSMSELPEPSAAELAARARLREIGRNLYLLGGEELMVDVFDTAVERYGYPGVLGATSAWDRIGPWQA